MALEYEKIENALSEFCVLNKKDRFLVAIDYDNTWTAKPKLWKAVVKALKDNDGDCICVTSRSKDTDSKELANSIGEHMPIVYADGKKKEKVAEDKGYTVNIWVDDKPETVK